MERGHTALVLALVVLRCFTTYIPEQFSITSANLPSYDPTIEGRFASGSKVALSELTEVELSFLETIPNAVRLRILEHREEVLQDGERFPLDEQYRAFLPIHGIGEKRAKQLAEQLVIE